MIYDTKTFSPSIEGFMILSVPLILLFLLSFELISVALLGDDVNKQWHNAMSGSSLEGGCLRTKCKHDVRIYCTWEMAPRGDYKRPYLMHRTAIVYYVKSKQV